VLAASDQKRAPERFSGRLLGPVSDHVKQKLVKTSKKKQIGPKPNESKLLLIAMSCVLIAKKTSKPVNACQNGPTCQTNQNTQLKLGALDMAG
jgi:hypothetical protein